MFNCRTPLEVTFSSSLVAISHCALVAEPLSIYVDTYGTGKKTDEELVAIIRSNWDLRPGVIGMLRDLLFEPHHSYM